MLGVNIKHSVPLNLAFGETTEDRNKEFQIPLLNNDPLNLQSLQTGREAALQKLYGQKDSTSFEAKELEQIPEEGKEEEGLTEEPVANGSRSMLRFKIMSMKYMSQGTAVELTDAERQALISDIRQVRLAEAKHQQLQKGEEDVYRLQRIRKLKAGRADRLLRMVGSVAGKLAMQHLKVQEKRQGNKAGGKTQELQDAKTTAEPEFKEVQLKGYDVMRTDVMHTAKRAAAARQVCVKFHDNKTHLSTLEFEGTVSVDTEFERPSFERTLHSLAEQSKLVVAGSGAEGTHDSSGFLFKLNDKEYITKTIGHSFKGGVHIGKLHDVQFETNVGRLSRLFTVNKVTHKAELVPFEIMADARDEAKEGNEPELGNEPEPKLKAKEESEDDDIVTKIVKQLSKEAQDVCTTLLDAVAKNLSSIDTKPINEEDMVHSLGLLSNVFKALHIDSLGHQHQSLEKLVDMTENLAHSITQLRSQLVRETHERAMQRAATAYVPIPGVMSHHKRATHLGAVSGTTNENKADKMQKLRDLIALEKTVRVVGGVRAQTHSHPHSLTHPLTLTHSLSLTPSLTPSPTPSTQMPCTVCQ